MFEHWIAGQIWDLVLDLAHLWHEVVKRLYSNQEHRRI